MFWGAWGEAALRGRGKMMSVVNGEEEPPAVRLSLVVTLEELGVLSSDLLTFRCFIVPLGFVFPFPFGFSL